MSEKELASSLNKGTQKLVYVGGALFRGIERDSVPNYFPYFPN